MTKIIRFWELGVLWTVSVTLLWFWKAACGNKWRELSHEILSLWNGVYGMGGGGGGDLHVIFVSEALKRTEEQLLFLNASFNCYNPTKHLLPFSVVRFSWQGLGKTWLARSQHVTVPYNYFISHWSFFFSHSSFDNHHGWRGSSVTQLFALISYKVQNPVFVWVRSQWMDQICYNTHLLINGGLKTLFT